MLRRESVIRSKLREVEKQREEWERELATASTWQDAETANLGILVCDVITDALTWVVSGPPRDKRKEKNGSDDR